MYAQHVVMLPGDLCIAHGIFGDEVHAEFLRNMNKSKLLYFGNVNNLNVRNLKYILKGEIFPFFFLRANVAVDVHGLPLPSFHFLALLFFLFFFSLTLCLSLVLQALSLVSTG